MRKSAQGLKKGKTFHCISARKKSSKNAERGFKMRISFANFRKVRSYCNINQPCLQRKKNLQERPWKNVKCHIAASLSPDRSMTCNSPHDGPMSSEDPREAPSSAHLLAPLPPPPQKKSLTRVLFCPISSVPFPTLWRSRYLSLSSTYLSIYLFPTSIACRFSPLFLASPPPLRQPALEYYCKAAVFACSAFSPLSPPLSSSFAVQ